MALRGTEDGSESNASGDEGDCVEAPSEEIHGVTILSKGKVIQYRIPSFPVYKAELVEIKIQYEEEDGNVLVFDAFARYCDDINHELPAIAMIPYSFDNAFMIEVGCA